MKYITIDPAGLGTKAQKPCYAYLGKAYEYKPNTIINIDNLSSVYHYMREIERLQFNTVIIEDGYIRFIKPALQLERARQRLTDAALRQGLTVHRLPITTWQSGMLKGAPGATVKARSLFVASDLVGREVTDDNEADAINMWFWVQRNMDYWKANT